MSQHTRDLIVGAFVATGLAVIAYLSISVGGAQVGSGRTYTVYAAFNEIGGLTTRSPVVIGGVKIGRVESITLGDNFDAVVGIAIPEDMELPTDTSASILTAGVLGNQYVGLTPGGEEDPLQEGDYIPLTQDAIVLERLIGRLVQNLGVD